MTRGTVWQGKFLKVVREGRWEYAERTGDIDAAVIVAVDEGHLLLIEQQRIPTGGATLELPAGLVGDDGEAEDATAAAARELEEETGYRADTVEALGVFYSSPGMTSEKFTLVRASGLTKVGEPEAGSCCTGCRWARCRRSSQQSAMRGWASTRSCCCSWGFVDPPRLRVGSA